MNVPGKGRGNRGLPRTNATRPKDRAGGLCGIQYDEYSGSEEIGPVNTVAPAVWKAQPHHHESVRARAGVKSSAVASETCLLLNVGVVAKGSRCLSVMHILRATKSSRVRLRVVGIAPIKKSASCYKYAGEMGIQVFEDYRDLLSMEYLDLILELTGDEFIMSDIVRRKRSTVGVLDRQASMRLFDMAQSYAQEDLRESEIMLATSFAYTMLEVSPDGVLFIDREFRIIDCNTSHLIPGSACKDDILGKHCFEVIHGSSHPCEELERTCPVYESQKTGKPARTVHEIAGSNNVRQVRQITAYPIYNWFGEIAQFVLAIRDITEDLSKRIELYARALKKDLARVVQEDRLTSLGRLVASVCHEINNPITSIVTFTKLVRSMVRQGELSAEESAKIERYLDLSFNEAMRCGCIVKNLLTFARRKSVEARTIEIHEIVDTILLLTSHQFEIANVRCSVNLPPPPFTAWGDYAQIQQCLLNLIFNAIDAMPGGGTIAISGGTSDDADHVWLAVSDTGLGIEPGELQRIFEPFYSTKADGKGVGLGLSMVYGIIREHNGTVEVESEPGKGTTFRIKLPVRSANSAETRDLGNS